MESQKPFYASVAERLIAQLEAGTAPWQKPWRAGEPPGLLPMNPTTGKRYKGINAVQLMSRGHADPRWMTYKQAQAAGAQVRAGQAGTSIQYWKFSEDQPQTDARGQHLRDAQGQPLWQTVRLERPRVFFATVFNAEQIDGLPPLALRAPDWNPVERAEQLLQASGARIEHGEHNRAFYRPDTDSIHLPARTQFATPAQYYAIALHELGHWSGHASRLDRDQSHPYASEGYAQEELRAEIASMILGEELGIGHDPGQHAAYVGSWIALLRSDPLEVFRAAADAEKIQGYLLGLEHQQAQAAQPAPEEVQAQPEPPLQRATFLHVPFEDKEEAKALGARWHRQAQAWFVPAGVDAAAFSQWTHPVRTPAGPERELQPDRAYLAVPYGERKAAKAAGAAWDPAARSWFVGPDADAQKLARWQPGGLDAEQGPAMRPQEEFALALRAMGCVVSGEHPVMDGKKHHIAVEGAASGSGDGEAFYIGHLAARASGYIKNPRTGIDMQWKSKGYRLEPGEKERMLAEAGSNLRARADALLQVQEQAAERVRLQMAELLPAAQPTPYMQAKGIAPQAGVFTDRDGKRTCVPVVDADGRQWSMQYIEENGARRFAQDGRRDGCFHAVGGLDALARAPALVIGESYATASSLSQSLGFATVAAFESGNLPAVAKALHARFPDKPVVIAADDDRHLELTQGINPGKAKAREAARSTGGTVLLPVFAAGENLYPAELPAITPQKYREHLRTGNALAAEQLSALAQMKGMTDFNDLSQRSALGQPGLERQVRPAVQDAIDKRRLQLASQEHAVRQAPQAARGAGLRVG